MVIRKKERCFNPWYGYLVILAVCTIIASAIFFESKGHRHHRAIGVQPQPAVAMQAAFPSVPAGGATTDEKLVF
ncbi:MAG: hypothetical protein HQL13_04460 [Candidatus Omnitrophica bacterium]|nr:hypothetical protein [Candidatus Omnitrophota bacterium]